MENKVYHTFLVSEKVLTVTISHYPKNSSLLSSYYEKKPAIEFQSLKLYGKHFFIV